MQRHHNNNPPSETSRHKLPKKDETGTGLSLDNRLQLPGVTHCILDNRAAGDQNVLLGPRRRLGLHGEVYPSVTQHPPALLSELDDGPFGLEE